FTGDDLPKIDRLAGLPVVQSHKTGHYVVVRSESGFTASQIAELEENPGVRYVEPNYPYELTFSTRTRNTDDTEYPKLWGMKNINAPEAWDVVHDAPNVIVAVLDTGVDYRHVDLKDNIWTNPGEIGKDAAGRDKSTNHLDDDGNGYKDDVHGYDFIDD